MNYPIVTERQVQMEPVVHDPFIDSLAPPPRRPSSPRERPRRTAARPRPRPRARSPRPLRTV
jgi:hypothetical protein